MCTQSLIVSAPVSMCVHMCEHASMCVHTVCGMCVGDIIDFSLDMGEERQGEQARLGDGSQSIGNLTREN